MLSNITAHMIEKCPLKHGIVRCVSCSNPNTLVLSAMNESSKLEFSKMLVKLTALKQICIKLADDVKEKFSKFIAQHVPENRKKFSSFAKFDQRLGFEILTHHQGSSDIKNCSSKKQPSLEI